MLNTQAENMKANVSIMLAKVADKKKADIPTFEVEDINSNLLVRIKTLR